MAALRSFQSMYGTSSFLFSRMLNPNAINSISHVYNLSLYATPTQSRNLRSFTPKHSQIPETPSYQETVVENTADDDRIRKEIVDKVNLQISTKTHGRLFAVVHVYNKQWKITPEDIMVVEGYWPPNVGDEIRLEKVLLVGSSDFTIVGAPLLQPDLVNIRATVLEKNLSHTRFSFFYLKRKQTRTMNFYRYQQTVLRINSIDFGALLNQKRDVEGLHNRIF